MNIDSTNKSIVGLCQLVSAVCSSLFYHCCTNQTHSNKFLIVYSTLFLSLCTLTIIVIEQQITMGNYCCPSPRSKTEGTPIVTQRELIDPENDIDATANLILRHTVVVSDHKYNL